MITIKFFAPGEDFSAVRPIRETVFCEEQGNPLELEFDEYEETSYHLAVFDDENAVACGRLTMLSDTACRLGRIAVLKPYRGRKLGALIMQELMGKANELGAQHLAIHAQTYAVPFYERFGFSACGVEYCDEGIPLVPMAKNCVFDDCRWLEFFDGAEALYFRREFSCEQIAKAELSITGLGFFELYVNGARWGDDLNVPAWSDYEKRPLETINMPIFDTLSHRIYYMNYDITSALREGKNTLGVHIGSGWYGQHESRNEGFKRCGELKLCYKLTITTTAGEQKMFVSDENGRYAKSHITRASIYFGETHDMRLWQSGWNETSFDDSAWRPPHAVPAPKSLLCEQVYPTDKVIRTIEPTKIKEFGDYAMYDLGEGVAGYAVVRFLPHAQVDSHVYVRYADDLLPDGSLDFESTGGQGRMQRDVFICDKKHREQLLYPRFTWHAGRYFELLGDAEVVEFRVVHSDIPCTSSFESSNETLNWIYEAYIRTQLDNIHCCVPSDCPHRERLGYTGDGQITCRSVMTMFDAKGLYLKWMQDIADCQDRYNGHVQHTAPFYGGGGGPGGWGGAVAIVPWNFYLFYGDTGVLAKYYPHIVKYLEYMNLRSKNGLVVREEDRGWCLGDWNPPGGNDNIIPEPFVNTYYYVRCLEIAKNAANILGIAKDILFIEKKLAECKQAITGTYFDPATGSFCGGHQGADAFALDIGLGDERLLGNIIAKYSALGHYDTGIFGTDVLNRVLFKNGRAPLAFKLLTNESDISFNFMKRSGATTIWEEWGGRNSKNHPMFGSVVEYFFSHILGIRQKEGCTAWTEYEVSPADIPDLAWAKGHITTPQGEIHVHIRRDENGKLQVEHRLAK
ncbi:MAG: GNAT family N-acetyltransferase [Oscillospiraceae bacterium]|jgi:alpha-L-rhamnosidase|nr:GNAT family N-acetyltransferase [Oscillospiraceae bacterium]